jgi:mannose/cellobiose epimerase-like protein (N-acyl-D-glucosamine 2-epimerase family)
MALSHTQADARTWLFEHAAPFWASRGVHSDGMFVEAFSRTGKCIDNIRRARVQARQIYSFCEIGRLGWTGPWRDTVATATDHLVNKGINEDSEFIHAFDASGAVADDRPDLYNQAFGLFALAHAGEALGRRELFDLAERVLDRLEYRWSKSQGGYWEGAITPCPPFRQNPHMHMFEAGLAHYTFTGNPRWKEFATRIAEMFKGRFQDSASGAVTEYFTEDWKPLPPPEGIIVEPGHCLEWAWLFETAFDPVRDTATAEQLLSFARRWGICNKRGLAINEVSLSGEVIDGRARLWPQTERLKSAVARYRRTGAAQDEQEIVDAYQGLTRYFDHQNPAIWYDKIDEAGLPLDEPAPASSFYHIVCGLSELLNV